MSALQQWPRFVAAGEALTDLIAQNDARDQWISCTGGATWNVARVVAGLGIPSAFAGAVSQDVFGDQLCRASAESQLDLRFLQRHPKSPLLAVVYSTTPPRYAFVGDDSADLYFDPAALPAAWEQHCEWAHFGGISLARQPLATTLITLAQTLKDQGVRISFDPNFRNLMDPKFDPTFERMVRLADVVKVSDEDLLGLFRTPDLDGAFAQMRRWNPQATVLYTRGPHGASIHTERGDWICAVPEVQVVDTVGAGDASMGGLVCSLMQRPQASAAEHLRYAVATGAAACLKAGANSPTLEVVQQLVQRLT